MPVGRARVREAGWGDQGRLIVRPYPLTGPCIDFPPTAPPDTAHQDTATPAPTEPDPPAAAAEVEVDQALVALPVIASEQAADGHQPGLVEQHAITLVDAQQAALDGVEDAWKAAGHALAGIGRRRRRRER